MGPPLSIEWGGGYRGTVGSLPCHHDAAVSLPHPYIDLLTRLLDVTLTAGTAVALTARLLLVILIQVHLMV